MKLATKTQRMRKAMIIDGGAAILFAYALMFYDRWLLTLAIGWTWFTLACSTILPYLAFSNNGPASLANKVLAEHGKTIAEGTVFPAWFRLWDLATDMAWAGMLVLAGCPALAAVWFTAHYIVREQALARIRKLVRLVESMNRERST